FFQAEDGIRDRTVTGVQTGALPISRQNADRLALARRRIRSAFWRAGPANDLFRLRSFPSSQVAPEEKKVPDHPHSMLCTKPPARDRNSVVYGKSVGEGGRRGEKQKE